MDPPFVLSLLAIGAGIGLRLLDALQASGKEATRLERGLVATALGLGLLQYLPFALGAAGLLTPATVWSGLVVATIVAAGPALRILRAVRREAAASLSTPRLALRLGLIGLVAVSLSLAFLVALTPPTEGDAIAYHLTGPKRWLQAERLVYLPTLVSTSHTMGVEMLYTICLAVWSDTAAKLTHFALGVLALMALYALGRRLRNDAAGGGAALWWLSGVLPALSPIYLFGWAYADMGITFLLAATLVAFLAWMRTGHGGWMASAALCAGLTASFKLTGALTGLLLAAAAFWHCRTGGARAGSAIRLAASFWALSLAPLLPWLARNLVDTGNPVFPAFSSLFPTRDWSPAAAARFEVEYRYQMWGLAFGQGWSLDQRKLIRGGALVVAFVAWAIALWRVREPRHRVVVWCCGGGILTSLWFTGLQFRLMLPSLALLYTLVCSGVCSWRWGRRACVAGAVAALLLATIRYARWQARSAPRMARVAVGAMTRAEFLQGSGDIFRMWAAVNRLVPPTERIVAAGISLQYGLPFGGSYYADPYVFSTGPLQERIRTDSWQTLLQDLRREGIAYAVAPTTLPEWRREAIRRRQHEWDICLRLVRERGEELYRAGDVALYRLRL